MLCYAMNSTCLLGEVELWDVVLTCNVFTGIELRRAQIFQKESFNATLFPKKTYHHRSIRDVP